MKSRILTCITAMTLFAALAIPVQLAAQHTRYKLIDIGTLGGPTSYFSAGDIGELVLNNRGMLAGSADTATPDPDCLNGGDCFVTHAFRWQDGVLTDLGTLSGGNFSLGARLTRVAGFRDLHEWCIRSAHPSLRGLREPRRTLDGR